MKSLLLVSAALAFVFSSATAHVSYFNRNFGTLTAGSGSSINTQTVSSAFGWADATDDDWGDSHRTRAFRFTLSSITSVQISVSRNALGTGATGTFLPAFSLYSGLAHVAPAALSHDQSAIGVEYLVVNFGTTSGGLGGSGKEGAFRALHDWTIGNDPVYNTPGDPTSGIAIPASLVTLSYVGHIADGTASNYGGAGGITGDGVADGSVSTVFADLAPGDYSLFIGGANYDAQLSETGAPFPTYGINVTVSAIPEPASLGLAASGLALVLGISRRKGQGA